MCIRRKDRSKHLHFPYAPFARAPRRSASGPREYSSTRSRSRSRLLAAAPVYVPRYYALSSGRIYRNSPFNATTLLFPARHTAPHRAAPRRPAKRIARSLARQRSHSTRRHLIYAPLLTFFSAQPFPFVNFSAITSISRTPARVISARSRRTTRRYPRYTRSRATDSWTLAWRVFHGK